MGAVAVRSGELKYFDSRDAPLRIDHVMASAALPPAFAAVRIEGEAYWDGGVYSNTPIEAVLNDHPRRSSVIFSVNVWQPTGVEPKSIWEVMGRQKDIQYASRADSHIARQKELHHLRHVIRELAKRLPESTERKYQLSRTRGLRLRHDHAYRSAACADARFRGLLQGHRLQWHGHSQALGGGDYETRSR